MLSLSLAANQLFGQSDPVNRGEKGVKAWDACVIYMCLAKVSLQ